MRDRLGVEIAEVGGPDSLEPCPKPAAKEPWVAPVLSRLAFDQARTLVTPNTDGDTFS